MKKKKWIITSVILVVFCAGLFVYNHYRGSSSAADPAEISIPRKNSVLNVNGLVVRPQTLTDGITSVGSLLPDEEVDLSFETSGKIVSINFQEGSTVRKGELLAKVNDKPLLAQLSRYEAQLKLAEDRVYRQSALLEKDAVSQEAYEQARTELAMLNADIDIVRSNIALTELHAPFDGVIGLRNVSEGAYASPSVVVAKLTKIKPLKIDLSVPERYASQIKPGTRLTFTVEGYNETFHAEVYATESKIDPNTHYFSVRAHYPNTRGRLLPGRFVSVKIRMHDIPDAIAIGVGVGAVMALLMQFIAPSVVRPFTSDEAVVKAGAAYIRSYIFDCLFAGIQFSFSGYFCAWGRSGLSFLHNTLSILLVRVPGAWLACRFFPQTLVPMGLAPACGSLFSSIVCVLLYRWMKRQNKPTGDKD